jgi:serine/threonine protein kinase
LVTTGRFGPFSLLRRLAVTGLAEVFLAQLPESPEYVAVKRLLPHAQEDAEIVSLFLSEAALVQRLEHPNVVGVVSHGFVERSPYIAYAYVPGDTLASLIKTLVRGAEGLDDVAVASIALQLAQGLTYIHNVCRDDGTPLNIVHRDLTPGNVMISPEGTVQILDFGIATYTGREHLTGPGIRKGKAAYMSPEQIRGEPLDRRSDVFALGVVLMELATATRLFKEEDVLRTFERIENVDIPRASSSQGSLETMIRRCLVREREERPDLVLDVIPCMQKSINLAAGKERNHVLSEVYNRYLGASNGALPGHPIRSALPSSAEERGEETTDQKEHSDITLMGESPCNRHKEDD